MKHLILLIVLQCVVLFSGAQDRLKNLIFSDRKVLVVESFTGENEQHYKLKQSLPFLSLWVNGTKHSADAMYHEEGGKIIAEIAPGLNLESTTEIRENGVLECLVRFRNISRNDVVIENIVPFGESGQYPYITATGTKEWPQYLCRSVICRPGYAPVGIVLPDNAWHLGWSDVELADGKRIAALARRGKRENCDIDRWASTIHPEGWVEYIFRYEMHDGEWLRGLEQMFRNRWLYDLDSFDESLYHRNDLAWMRHSYLMLLQFAWDKTWYDSENQHYTFYDELRRYDQLIGGWDVYTIWPTWPRLGLDERNQFDMYRDLPGGIQELRKQARFCHEQGKKYFISYNPWDAGTRHEEHMSGLENLIREIDADGVVLDCKGESSRELQAAADRAKPGVIMYSEGMAVPKDMPGIVSGRVHNALFMPPPVNLNKFIKPDFAIFRVIDLAENDIRREIAISFFNGIGIEINTMRPGRPDRIEEDYCFLGRTTRILRENTSAFCDMHWNPFVETKTDSIWVNKWADGDKQIYTVFSLRPEGYHGPLFRAENDDNFHWVSLWHHRETATTEESGVYWVGAETEAFSSKWIGTRREGSVECIARLPKWLNCRLTPDTLFIETNRGDEIWVWAGNPSYQATPVILKPPLQKVALNQFFADREDKFVVQLFGKGELLDEKILQYTPGTPRLVSLPKLTDRVKKAPGGMVEIPAGIFKCIILRDSLSQDPFIPLPDYSKARTLVMNRFFMDRYPVTNQQFFDFLEETGYRPADTVHFLRHWSKGKPPAGLENHPVVYVSLADARAYARWTGKRLPTEQEWQYAAQGNDNRRYPWGNNADFSRCNFNLNHTTPVDKYPKGKSPFGVMDLVGNVWQMTDDEYDNGSYRFNVIRGGSYYHPQNSEWYVTGGPVPVSHPEILLMVSPSFDRSATIGFRCVKDAAD